jgi:hypothetical protein
MRPFILSAVVCLLFVGCQHIELRNHTLRQASTLTDLQYQQVLDNLAMFVQNPGSLPYFSITGTGLTNTNNQFSEMGSFNWDKQFLAGKPLAFFFDKASATFGGMQIIQEQWTTGSIIDPDALLLMRCVYQRTTTNSADLSCDCDTKLSQYFQKKPCYLEAMRPGWYGVGSKHDVPTCAKYVGHCGHVYVWVTPDNVDYLTRLTLAILDLATFAAPQGQFPVTKPPTDEEVIVKLIQRVKDLEDILAKYPVPFPKAPPQEYMDLQARLKNTAQVLAEKLKGMTHEQIKNMVSGPDATLGISEAELQRILEVPSTVTPEAAPLFTPRKNFYNPLQQVPPPQ